MIKKNQIEMIADRGYDISKEQDILNLEGLKFKGKLNRLYKKGDESIYVFYINDVDDIKLFRNKMKQSDKGIIIGSKEILKKLEKQIYDKYFDQTKQIQRFNYDELTYNLTKHILSPKYIATDISMITPSVHVNQLPILMANDPAVKYYGFPVGQVVKIIDENLFTDILMNENVSYCVVSPKEL